MAAFAKLHGRRLERRWPFLPKSDEENLNLGFEDVLEFQYARSRNFFFVGVGAFDGLENDPISRFIRSHDCRGILIEPQPAVFQRLMSNYACLPNVQLLNAAIDAVSGSREFYSVPAGIEGLPSWTEQLASFRKEHLIRHEDRAPGLSAHIRMQMVDTICFPDLLDKFGIGSIDVLQIDAEGMDAQLLAWFPFERIKPSILHYEIAHMSADELTAVRSRLKTYGYTIRETNSSMDDFAVLV